MTEQPEQLSELQQSIVSEFGLEEIASIASDLGLQLDDLPAPDIESTVAMLVDHCRRNDQLKHLEKVVAKRRPGVPHAAELEASGKQEPKQTLLQILVSHFNEDQLKDLSFELSIDYDGLPGEGRANKAREMLGHIARNGLQQELIRVGKAIRPDIPWGEAPGVEQLEQRAKDLGEDQLQKLLVLENRERDLTQHITHLHAVIEVERDPAVRYKLLEQLAGYESRIQEIQDQIHLFKSEERVEERAPDTPTSQLLVPRDYIQADRDAILRELNLGVEMEALRSILVSLLPVAKILDDLDQLKTHIDSQGDTESTALWSSQLSGFLESLNQIEVDIVESTDPTKQLQTLHAVKSSVQVIHCELRSRFMELGHEATGSLDLVRNLVLKIGHREFRQEAEAHLRVIRPLWEQLNSEGFEIEDTDITSTKSYSKLSLLSQMWHRRREFDDLVRRDRSRRRNTAIMVSAYIAIAVIGLTTLVILNPGRAPSTWTSLQELRLPIIGIPWPVIVWALIGSFAAMIYQFNRNPIHDFGDTLKWLLTRPVQGLVLGAAFYQVLLAGLFLFTGPDVTSTLTDEVVLVLVFLVGFSDRFADQVFRTLIRRYSPQEPDSETGSESSSQTKV